MPGERSGEGKGNGCHRACAVHHPSLLFSSLQAFGRVGGPEQRKSGPGKGWLVAGGGLMLQRYSKDLGAGGTTGHRRFISTIMLTLICAPS